MNRYTPRNPPPAPLKPELQRGVQLVDAGMDVVVAATVVGATATALRSACRNAGVRLLRGWPGEQKRQRRLARRDAEIMRRHRAQQALDLICREVAVSARLVQRVIERELGERIAIPKRPYVRRRRTKTVRMLQADVAAQAFLIERAKGDTTSMAQYARRHGVSRHVFAAAVARLREKSVDASSPVSDTGGERSRQ
jgi:hypothetical protein